MAKKKIEMTTEEIRDIIVNTPDIVMEAPITKAGHGVSDTEPITYRNIAKHLTDHRENCPRIKLVEEEVEDLMSKFDEHHYNTIKVGQGVIYTPFESTVGLEDKIKRVNGNAYRIFTDLDESNLYSMLWWDIKSTNTSGKNLTGNRYSNCDELIATIKNTFTFTDYPVQVFCYLKQDDNQHIKISEHNSLFSRIKLAPLSSETPAIPVSYLDSFSTLDEIQSYNQYVTLVNFVTLVYQEFLGVSISDKDKFLKAVATFNFNKLHKLRNNVPSINKVGTQIGVAKTSVKINKEYQTQYGYNTVTNIFEPVNVRPNHSELIFDEKKFISVRIGRPFELIANDKMSMTKFADSSSTLAVCQCHYTNASNQRCVLFRLYQCGSDNFSIQTGYPLTAFQKIIMQIDTPQTLPKFKIIHTVSSKNEYFYRLSTENIISSLSTSFYRKNSSKISKEFFKFALLNTDEGIISNYSAEFELDTNNKSRCPFIKRV